MAVRTVMLVITLLCMSWCPAKADFKYTQSGEVTDGSDRGKALGIQAAEITIYVQGGFLRIDLPDGTYGLIDLEGQREILVDPKTRTYSIVTFDELRAVYKRTEQSGPLNTRDDLNVKVTTTGKTRTLLNQIAQDTKIEILDTATQGLVIHSWNAPSGSGFSEVTSFYQWLSSALRSGTYAARLPALMGVAQLMTAMEAGSSHAIWPAFMSKGIIEVDKAGGGPDGLPLLQIYRQYIPQPAAPETGPKSASPSDAKKQSESRSASASPVSAEADNSEGSGQELAIEFTLRITSFSADKLDKELFQIPPGYRESHLDRREMWIAGLS